MIIMAAMFTIPSRCNMGSPQVLENLLENCYVPRAKVRNLANEIITMLGNPEDFSAPPMKIWRLNGGIQELGMDQYLLIPFLVG